MTKLTHYKTLQDPDYIGAYSLDKDGTYVDKDVLITMVEKKKIKTTEGDEECIVATLKGEKPMILNATNCKMLTKLFKSPHIEHWVGKPITLYVRKVKAWGDDVDALRIRDVLPVTKKIDPTKFIEALDKATNLDELKKIYAGLSKVDREIPEVVKKKDELKEKFSTAPAQ